MKKFRDALLPHRHSKSHDRERSISHQTSSASESTSASTDTTTASNITPPCDPPLAEPTQLNTSPDVSLPPVVKSSVASPGRVILDLALKELDEDELKIMRDYATEGGNDLASALDGTYEAAKKRQAEYKAKAWVFTVGKHKIQLKEVADNIVKFLDKFKDAGDVLVEIDTAHAGLPWAAFKVLLTVHKYFASSTRLLTLGRFLWPITV
jgi:hypothetical protein